MKQTLTSRGKVNNFIFYRQSDVSWSSDLLANFHPSYYGMMVAQFIPENTSIDQQSPSNTREL